ncbi:MAG: efflux RND transporter permease subunit, partial [Acidobacteriota bacterium]
MSTLFYRNRYLLTLSIVIVLVGGLSAIFTLPRLEDPRISNRNAVIVTVLPGASAERVEALVTEKLEEELRELSEIDEITSISRAGVSLLTVALKGKITDTEPVWAKLRDKLADAERLLPPEALPPDFDETRAPPAFTLLVGLSWQGESEPQEAVLKRLGEELADRLRNVRATDIVRVYGEAEEEITVTVDPDEVAALGLSIDDIGRRVADADSKVPAGALRGSASDVFIEVAGELDSLERIASIPLRDGVEGELLRLGDIATLERAPRQPRGELALVGGRPGVLVAARVEANQRVDLWARNANAVVDRFERELAGGVGVERVFDQSFYTLSRLGTLVQNLILGGCIVVGVILFTMGWRSALLVAAAVPLSASSVLFGLNLSGVPLHQISVTGLIIALGLLIDNAIVMVEEVHHRMRDGSRLEAIAGAVGHLFVPLLGSTLTTVISFLPIFLLSGNVGEFVYTIAVSVILALLSSFTIAMTILP